MSRRNVFLVSTCLLAACAVRSPRGSAGQVPEKEGGSQGEWIALFDGGSLDRWKSSSTQELIPHCWRIQDGELLCTPKEERPSAGHASLVTREQFSDFELVFEFRLDPPAPDKASNSGVKYFVYPLSELGLEYQLYARIGEVEGPHATADLYDLFRAEGARLNPFDEWNEARIVSRGRRCEHWLNGVRVLEFERGSEDFREAVAGSKFKKHPTFGERQEGHILLQDHGGRVRFRNIKIKTF